MVKLNASTLRFMSKEEFRVLISIEMGMKNHELVPTPLIAKIAGLRHGGIDKLLSNVLRYKLVRHEGAPIDGYKLTYQGYDFLALRVLLARGHIVALGNQVGVGKESDIYSAQTPDGETVVLKFHRLGRVSFRAVKSKRDYLQHRAAASWLYLSRLAATKEFAFMKALYTRGFPTPVPIDHNRHVVCMTIAQGIPLCRVKKLQRIDPIYVYEQAMALLERLARCGLVHCDFNEFNLIMGDKGDLTLIDFPQMISTSHANADFFFDRDVQSIVRFFKRLQIGGYGAEHVPTLSSIRSGGGLYSAHPLARPPRQQPKQVPLSESVVARARIDSDTGVTASVASVAGAGTAGEGPGAGAPEPNDPCIDSLSDEMSRIDVEVRASGFTKEMSDHFTELLAQQQQQQHELGEEVGTASDDDGDDCTEEDAEVANLAEQFEGEGYESGTKPGIDSDRDPEPVVAAAALPPQPPSVQPTGASASAVPAQEAAAATDSHAGTAELSMLPVAAADKVKASKAQGKDGAKSAARRAQIRERVKKDLARRDAKKKAASRNFNKKFVKGSRKLKFKASDHI